MRIQLELLSSLRGPATWTVERFPCVIGRAASADLRLEEPGIWDKHLELQFRPRKGVSLTVLPGALATRNGEPLTDGILRNGDLIEAGGAKLRFWLGPTSQRDYELRETVTWLGLAALFILQIWLVSDALGTLWARLFYRS